MAPASGDTVRIHYRGTLADGSEFDCSQGREPLEFKLGEGEVIPGFERAVESLAVGESVTVTIPATDAYGERVDDAVQTAERAMFGGDAPEVGWVVQLTDPDGNDLMAQVLEVTDEVVTLDFNHPLAGEDLTFEIELVEVVEA